MSFIAHMAAQEVGALRVLIADDHAPTREDVRRALADGGLVVCAEAADAARERLGEVHVLVTSTGPSKPPRLASRPPQLRSIETQLGEALRDGRLRRKGGEHS